MLRNTVDMQAIKNRQKFPKNNHFAYKWRVLDNFNKSIERQMYYMNMWGANNHRTLMNDKILQLYKSRYQGSRTDLIVDLVSDTMQFLQKRRIEHHKLSQVEVTLSKATMCMIDHCFNTLLSFATELNSILGLSELFITGSEPEIKKRSNSSENSIPTYIQAHLSTSLYRLVLEGKQDQLKFYIIPADNLSALNEVHLQYNPVESWRAHFAGEDNAIWISASGSLSDESVDIACVHLLRLLIETTQERLMPAAALEQDAQGFKMAEPDPWMQNRSADGTTRSDFEAKSGYGPALASLDDEYEYLMDYSNDWRTVGDIPEHAFAKMEMVDQMVQREQALPKGGAQTGQYNCLPKDGAQTGQYNCLPKGGAQTGQYENLSSRLSAASGRFTTGSQGTYDEISPAPSYDLQPIFEEVQSRDAQVINVAEDLCAIAALEEVDGTEWPCLQPAPQAAQTPNRKSKAVITSRRSTRKRTSAKAAKTAKK